VNADFQEIHPGWKGFVDPKSFKMRNFDIVFCEDGYSMRLAAFQKALGAKFQIFRLIGTAGHYNLAEKGISLKGELWASKKVDGAIAISEWIKEYAEPYFNCEIEVVNPFISEEKYEKLGQLEYTPDTGKILFVGRHWDKEESRKGLDLIEEAIIILEEKGYDLEVLSVGNRGEKIEYDANIRDLGYVDDEELFDLFEEAELFLQPSKRDGWSVAVLEAMKSGTPPIVSENVGSKELVKNLDRELVCGLKPDSLAESIENFLDKEKSQKEQLSEEARELSEPYTRERKVEEFQTKFQKSIINK
jgi:glycosyltransferase involved in cell wall biosynthesis